MVSRRTSAGARICALAASAILWLVGGAIFAPAPAHAQAAKAGDMIEVCKGCHEDHVASYLTHKHGQKGNVKGPDCQTCHGNTAEHVKQNGGIGVGGIVGFNNKKVSAEQKSGTCLSCHGGNRHLAFWDAGKHKKGDVACTDCHSLHNAPGAGSTIALKQANPSVTPYQTTTRQLQYETCTTCHKQIRSQLTKPSHHPIIEGRIACTDCHNPHGTLSKMMVKAETIPALCTGCHAEKRGPFVWGHPPVEENCLTCHNAHGSNHARLLAEKAPNVCQDCHDASRHPGSVYGAGGSWTPNPPGNASINTRLIARGCANCHFQIHGTNAPGMRGKFFLR